VSQAAIGRDGNAVKKMPGIECSKDDCAYNSRSQIPADSAVSDHPACLVSRSTPRLFIHPQLAMAVGGGGGGGGHGAIAKVEKVPRPVLKHGVGQDDFQFFLSRWDAYKRSCQLTDVSEIRDQLVACCKQDLMIYIDLFLFLGFT
jgi:hypothetical protein